MGNFIALEKAEAFAVRITKAYSYLVEKKGERRISDQLYRSGTSIQANLSEAQYAASHADFINKVHIALKEANESRSWINLLYNTEFLDKKTYDSIFKDINEIVIILIAILKKAKDK